MSMSRRQFLASLGGTGLFYAFRFVPAGTGEQSGPFEPIPMNHVEPQCVAEYTDIDYCEWIVFGPGDNVSVFTGRTELGQGLKTVITAIVTQGLEIPPEKLTVVQGDTDCCPDDGPTVGSAATLVVGWGFWIACETIRSDVVKRAARSLGIPVKKLEFKHGGVGIKGETDKLVNASDLGSGEAVILDIDSKTIPRGKRYTDFRIPNVNGEKIVTGQLKYVGDLHMPGLLYAGWLCQPYHPWGSRLQSADMKAAQALPGVKMVEVVDGRVAAVGERYSDVLKALDRVKAAWSIPNRPELLRVEEEARAGAELEELKLDVGDVNAGFAASDFVYSETYSTQYAAHAQIETDTAVAAVEDVDGRVTVWVSSQHPHLARELTADYLEKPVTDVRVIAMPSGGAFGGKIGNTVNREAAKLARLVNAPVKLVYSRKDQFQLKSYFKAACIIDVTTGVSADGMMLARKVETFNDLGEGTTDTYAIPNALTRAYSAKWPFGRCVMRGTSYVQTCFATESHVDMLAHKIGIDPLEFRRKNVLFPAFVNLIDTCAEMIGYGSSQLEPDEGIGLAIVKHGGAQLGVIAVRVVVDRVTGKIKVKHVCVAFDIGIVINRNTATATIRGGVAMGIGYALSEEVKLNGHRVETTYLSQYQIPRFSDMPPIEIVFLDNHQPGSRPRGCGEMPVIPTIGAIANAVYHAVGIRFYSTPLTPERVKQALGL